MERSSIFIIQNVSVVLFTSCVLSEINLKKHIVTLDTVESLNCGRLVYCSLEFFVICVQRF